MSPTTTAALIKRSVPSLGTTMWTPTNSVAWVKRVRLEGAGAVSTEMPETLDDILVAAAELHGGLSITQVAKATGVSRTLARKWLGWLEEEGRLVKVGRVATQRYVLPE